MNWCPITDITGHTVGQYGLSEPTKQGERYFEQIYVDPEHRGVGNAKRHYESIAIDLANNDQVLISDPGGFSTGALRVWVSLEKRGLAIRKGIPVITELGDVYGVSFHAVISCNSAA